VQFAGYSVGTDVLPCLASSLGHPPSWSSAPSPQPSPFSFFARKKGLKPRAKVKPSSSPREQVGACKVLFMSDFTHLGIAYMCWGGR
jgi:hypothetical protein